jgi:Transposase DDE domain
MTSAGPGSGIPPLDAAPSQRISKRIEEAIGWIKTVAGQERTKFRGRKRVGWAFALAAAAYNLARLPKLLEAST